MRNRVVVLFVLVLLAIAQFAPLEAQSSSQSTGHVVSAAAVPMPRPTRIIVKMRSDFAAQLEAGIPVGTIATPMRASGSAAATFLAQFGGSDLLPLYPNMVRAKLERKVSSRQLATEVRTKFASRARRSQTAFNPPDLSRTYVMELNDSSRLEQVIRVLKSDSRVEFAEEDKLMRVVAMPNDPYLSSSGTWGQSYDDLWGLKKIGALAAWGTTAGEGVTVAIVDTGIDSTHPDIAANIWTNPREIPGNGIDDDGDGYVDDVNGWNFVAKSNSVIDDFGHGTHVAGTIAAVGNNAVGVIGVAWRAKVLPVKALGADGFGAESDLANAVIYAANAGADVINNSWGAQGQSATVAEAVQYAYSLGVVVVAAAGNDAMDASGFCPANLPEAITVAATGPDDTLAYFSNYGEKVDVAAPGVDILSLAAKGTSMGAPVDVLYTRANGTSMAAPHISGVAALILSRHSEFSNEQIRQVLRSSAVDIGATGFDASFGYGLVDSDAAIGVIAPLEAKLTRPISGTSTHSAVSITGIARGDGFANYTLEYGAGSQPTSWTILNTSNAPTSGTLGVFDPAALADGKYVIRLRAYNTAGQAFEDRVRVVVLCSTITKPIPPDALSSATSIKPGSVVTITGYAVGAPFTNFTVDWARGVNPESGWQTTGISLAGGGLSAVDDGTLATWHTSSITERDYYTIRLTVHRGDVTGESRTIVYMEPSLLSANWPMWLSHSPTFASGVVPVASPSGNLLAWASNGFPSWLWISTPDASAVKPVALMTNAGLYQPSVADLDGTPGEEIAVAIGSGVQVFRTDGSTYAFRSGVFEPGIDFYYSQVIHDDLDGNSELETIALQQNVEGQSKVARLHAWRRDGDELNTNLPVTIGDKNGGLVGSAPRVLIGDIQGDGQKEFVVIEGSTASTFTPKLFANDGTPLEWVVPSFNGNPLQTALADLDHNGKLELIMVVNDPSEPHKSVHVLQSDGSERPGWPVSLMSPSDENVFTPAYLAVGDLARDGREEIVASDGYAVYVLNADGTTFSSAWPFVVPTNSDGMRSIPGQVALADVNGDGRPEILTTFSTSTMNPLAAPANAPSVPVAVATVNGANRANLAVADYAGSPRTDPLADTAPAGSVFPMQIELRLSALEVDGTVLDSWKLQGADGQQPCMTGVITVGDFNQDGLTEIAVNYLTVSQISGNIFYCMGPGVVTVYATGKTFNSAANDWPMLNRDPRNTAVLQREIEQLATSVSVTSQNNPSVFGQTVKVAVTVQAEGATGSTVAGTITVWEGSTSRGFCTLANAACSIDVSGLAAGAHSLTVTYSGNSRFKPSSNTLSQVVNQVATTTALTSSINPSVTGQEIALIASVTVVAPGSGLPTGTVTFYDGQSSIGTGTLNGSGQASLTVDGLPAGAHTLTASYAGDANFATSVSSSVSQKVTTASFTMTASTSKTVSAGQTATFSITVTPDPAPYAFAVSGFTCSGLPQGTACSFTPTSVAPGNSAATVQLSISTTARTAAAIRHAGFNHSELGLWLSGGFAGLLLLPGRKRSSKYLCLLALLACSANISCGGGGSSGGSPTIPAPPSTGTPAGTYNITVSATSGALTKTAAVTLQVN